MRFWWSIVIVLLLIGCEGNDSKSTTPMPDLEINGTWEGIDSVFTDARLFFRVCFTNTSATLTYPTFECAGEIVEYNNDSEYLILRWTSHPQTYFQGKYSKLTWTFNRLALTMQPYPPTATSAEALVIPDPGGLLWWALSAYDGITCSEPFFSVPGGVYHQPVYVSIETPTVGATIRYTLNGGEPSETSALYQGPIKIATGTTLAARVYAGGLQPGPVKRMEYLFACGNPVSDPPAGTFFTPVKVSLSSVTHGSVIRYTTDGSHPNAHSPVYTLPLKMGETTTIRAIATRQGYGDSEEVALTFIILWTVDPDFVRIPGGTFTMGSAEGTPFESPPHQVTVSTFYLCNHEVTQEEWVALMGDNPSYFTADQQLPVEGVSWYAVLKYCNLLSLDQGCEPVYSIGGETDPHLWGPVPNSNDPLWNQVFCNWEANGYRLPTEAEWEFAARGGINGLGYTYCGGNNPDDVCWYDANAGLSTHVVAGKSANELGLYDMSGNVCELCWDYFAFYQAGQQSDPHGPATGTNRIVRGGGYSATDDLCRPARRDFKLPYLSERDTGFRVVRKL